MKTFRKATPTLWQSAAIAFLATWALGPQVNASFGSGDTIGSHPNTQGDDDGQLETRPVFFLQGPAALVNHESRPYDYVGPGGATGVDTGLPGVVRIEFSPDLYSLHVDLDLLADPRVSAGFRVAPRGGVTRVRWDLGDHHSSVQTLPLNTSVELPVVRLRRAGMLEDGLGFSAFHGGVRTRYAVTSAGETLLVRPE